jgi:hypothetical protein
LARIFEDFFFSVLFGSRHAAEGFSFSFSKRVAEGFCHLQSAFLPEIGVIADSSQQNIVRALLCLNAIHLNHEILPFILKSGSIFNYTLRPTDDYSPKLYFQDQATAVAAIDLQITSTQSR